MFPSCRRNRVLCDPFDYGSSSNKFLLRCRANTFLAIVCRPHQQAEDLAIRDVQDAQVTPHEINLLIVPQVDNVFDGAYFGVLSCCSNIAIVCLGAS
jgi:hypothetical protein